MRGGGGHLLGTLTRAPPAAEAEKGARVRVRAGPGGSNATSGVTTSLGRATGARGPLRGGRRVHATVCSFVFAKNRAPGREEPGAHFLLQEQGAAVGKAHLPPSAEKRGRGAQRVKSA